MILLLMGMNPMRSSMLWSVVILTASVRVVMGQAPATPLPSGAMRLPSLPPTAPQSGIAYFRELLSAKPEEREKLLANKNAHYRAVMEAGIRRYEAYPPDEREVRLRSMELRYHVTSLLREPLRNRVERLKQVPEKDRPLVEERLKYWDQLSSAEQKEALENERMTRDVFSISSPPVPRQLQLNQQTSNQVLQIEQQLVRWQTLPDARRVQIQKNFTNLFEFSVSGKAKDQLQSLPLTPAERELMDKAIVEFKKLPLSTRLLCVRNFPKFAELSPQERQQFLVNAQEWQKMTPEDRQTWRRLVSKVPRLPPLPPGLGQPPKPQRVQGLPTMTAQQTNR